jgi:hypothetical protein
MLFQAWGNLRDRQRRNGNARRGSQQTWPIPGDDAIESEMGRCEVHRSHPALLGVLQDGHHPAAIAIFGIGPVTMRLVDAARPSWCRI